MVDKNGKEIKIGDRIKPDEGRILTIVSQAYIKEYEQDCLFGQQLNDDPTAFSILTQDNLSKQWTIVEEEE